MQGPRLTSTYRIQLNAEFPLARARAIVPYLDRLGISHLYCSPVLAARGGSAHGYDVVDPTRVNPEIGGEAELRALANELHGRGLGLILDVVPHHMSTGDENRYWNDVLAHGERSRFAPWFDVDWNAEPRRRVVLPVLGDTLDRVIERGELRIEIGESVRFAYFDQRFPIDASTLPSELPFAQGDPRFGALLDAQHYRLTRWKNPGNYRRFFDANDLVALRVEDGDVFEATHALVLRWVAEGVVDGLRVDHVDGLADPRQYLARLDAAGCKLLFVEKILAAGEQLSDRWCAQGTTGYDFLNDVDDLLLDPAGAADVERSYRRLRHLHAESFDDLAYEAKVRVLKGALRGDLRRLGALFRPLSAASPGSDSAVVAALTDFVASVPVYRTYIDADGASPQDRDVVERAVDRACARGASECAKNVEGRTPTGGAKRRREEQSLVRRIGDVLLSRSENGGSAARLAFVRRLQQLSTAVAAKGVEDTAFYQYLPLVSRNEVGGSPDRWLGDSRARFDAGCHHRANRWPLGLTCVTTHDTKRSADVRARLAALTEIPREWNRNVRRWRRLNARHKAVVGGRLVPDTNSEYLLYQTLVGIWPAPRAGRRVDDLPDRSARAVLRDRLLRYMIKAAREAKIHTSWTEPSAAYEQALGSFAAALIDVGDDAPFLGDLARLVARVAPLGQWNSLARTAIHLTAPGTPDVYQGDEHWELSLVDPDNRHPVDFGVRERAIATFDPQSPPARDPNLKLVTLHRLLEFRRGAPDLFMRGSYRMLESRGPRAGHVIAFTRALDDQTLITVTGLRLRDFVAGGCDGRSFWSGTSLAAAPTPGASRWRDLISGREVAASGGTMDLGTVLEHLPFAVLLST